jgi:hypothetical protein
LLSFDPAITVSKVTKGDDDTAPPVTKVQVDTPVVESKAAIWPLPVPTTTIPGPIAGDEGVGLEAPPKFLVHLTTPVAASRATTLLVEVLT